MQNELEKETQRVARDKRINDAVNSICQGWVEMGRKGQDWGELSLASNRLFKGFKRLNHDFDTLKDLVKDDPEKRNVVMVSEARAKSIQSQLYGLGQQLRQAPADDYDEIIRQARRRMNAEIDGIVSSGLLKIADDTRLSAANDKSAKMREKIRGVLNLALGVSIGLALMIAFLFSKNLGIRLGLLARNSELLARGETLLPRLKGSDEIADLDKAFHIAAQMIKDAKERERAASEELEQIRREVTGMITHDLKTPLQTINGYFQLLNAGKLGELDKRGADLLPLAYQSSERMGQIIESVLELEKIRAGKAQLKLECVDVSDLMRQSVDAIKLLADAKEISVAAPTSKSKLFINGDQHWMRQALVNLLANAINYAPNGTKVTLDSVSKNGVAEISVADEGPGIPDDEKELVFERFQRLDATAKAVAGSGLGLTFCKEMVALHRGRIEVEDNKPCGSKFVVRIPVYSES